jgi:hypothetical protein
MSTSGKRVTVRADRASGLVRARSAPEIGAREQSAATVRSVAAEVVPGEARGARVEVRMRESIIEHAAATSVFGVVTSATGVRSAAIAGADLGGHRAIHIDAGAALYAEPSIPSADRVAGITIGAAASGAIVNFQTSGEMVEPSWNWTEGPIYLGPSGTLTQTPPAAGVSVELGIATAMNKIIVRIGPPIRVQ